MKNLKYCTLAIVLAGLVGCEQHKKSTIDESGTEVVKVRTPTRDTLNKEAVPPSHTMTVEGKVLSINNGKDGYTATLKTTDGQAYDVTISHSNLTDHEQYMTVALGDRIKVTGDHWELDGKQQITVREIHK